MESCFAQFVGQINIIGILEKNWKPSLYHITEKERIFILKILLIAKNLDNFRSLPVDSGRELYSFPHDVKIDDFT